MTPVSTLGTHLPTDRGCRGQHQGGSGGEVFSLLLVINGFLPTCYSLQLFHGKNICVLSDVSRVQSQETSSFPVEVRTEATGHVATATGRMQTVPITPRPLCPFQPRISHP